MESLQGLEVSHLWALGGLEGQALDNTVVLLLPALLVMCAVRDPGTASSQHPLCTCHIVQGWI